MTLIIDPFQIILILCCIRILLLPQIFFLMTLQNTVKEVSVENRTIHPSQVWLTFIPLLGIFWQFFVIYKISQ